MNPQSCQKCSVEFTPKASGRKYCSKECFYKIEKGKTKIKEVNCSIICSRCGIIISGTFESKRKTVCYDCKVKRKKEYNIKHKKKGRKWLDRF